MKSTIIKFLLLLTILSFISIISFPRKPSSHHFSINVTPLDAGMINFPIATHIFYNTDPGFLQQAPASGGTGTYLYQWQSSPDANTWTDIPGETNPDFDPGTMTTTTYFRRSVFDGSQTLFTGHVLIAVCALMDPGFLTYNNPSAIGNGTDPGFIQEYGGVGGDCNNNSNNVYQWESSFDGGNTWTIIPSSNNENYDPGPLTKTISFRRKLSGGNQSGYTNTITITVLAALDPGSLNYNGNVATGTDPGPIPEIPATGGFGPSYNYVWESSTDGMNWSFVAFTETYDPGPLMQTTMFKRYVDDSHVSTITNTLTINVGVPLPLKFVYFIAIQKNEYVALNWTTAQEKNVKEFDVERSTDGLNFYSIGSVPFESNNSNYLFNDMQPNTGSNYYQIKETDIDGKSILSKIIKVVEEDQLFNIKIKKNPFSDQLSFICQSNIKQNATIIISDGLAKPMYQKQIKLNAGENYFAIDCKAWPSGIYFLQIIGYYNRISIKTIKL